MHQYSDVNAIMDLCFCRLLVKVSSRDEFFH
jgi:hypothetical protein